MPQTQTQDMIGQASNIKRCRWLWYRTLWTYHQNIISIMVKMPCMLVRKERAPDWLRTQQGPPTPRLCSDTLLMTELGVFVIFGMEKEPSQNKRVRGCAGFAWLPTEWVLDALSHAKSGRESLNLATQPKSGILTIRRLFVLHYEQTT